MTKKKILVGFPAPLLPVIGMSQVRTIEQIKRLSKDFVVDLAFIGRNKSELKLYHQKLDGICNEIFFIQHPKFEKGKILRVFRTIFYKTKYRFLGLPVEYQIVSNKKVQKRLIQLVNDHSYDLFLIHYWYMGIVFTKLPPNVYKAIDTHYVVQENKEILVKGLYEHTSAHVLKKELDCSESRQNEFFQNADILIFNSGKQADIIQKIFPEKHLIVTTNGQDVDNFLKFDSGDPDKILLFYGSLSNQFNKKAIKVLLDTIIPALKIIIPDLIIKFVGGGPPDWLKNLHNNEDLIVTGFVDDIRPHLSKSYVSILPLTTASGFRGRAIELMALGVPLIGTHNALDSIGITTGVNGYITDDVNEMIQLALKLFNNKSLRNEISENAKMLVAEHYTIEATFGELSVKINKILNTSHGG